MLYLAEVKKQTKGFMGGSKADLKLLACQHNDQSWSAVTGEEIISTEEIGSFGEGALLLVNLGTNRQVQGTPEPAGTELTRQLQKLSRLLEKSKDQQEEIDQWKQSLTYQSQELSRREMEIESRLDQLEQMEKEFEEFEHKRKEIEEAQTHLQYQQKRLEELQTQMGPIDWNSEQASKLQVLIARLSAKGDGVAFLWEQTNLAVESAALQHQTLETYRQQLEQEKGTIQQRQREIEQQQDVLKSRQQELEETKTSLQQARLQLQEQQAILASKQELLNRINLDLQTTEELQDTLSRLSTGGGDVSLENPVDIAALENMPLGELQELVKKLQEDLEKLVRFVNDQEEELTFQSQAVRELQDKLATANDYDRFGIETEIAEEQERMKMLDETLMGQRRTLRERQAISSQHLRILRRRQGIIDSEERPPQIDLEPMLVLLEDRRNSVREERQRLENEIGHLQQSLRQIRDIIDQQEGAYQRKAQELQAQEAKLQQAKLEIAELGARISVYEESLHPLQERLTAIRQKLAEIAPLFNPDRDAQQQAIA